MKYDRNARFAGVSSFSIVSYLSMAINGVVRTSIRPLYLSIILSFASIFSSICLIIFYLLAYIFSDVETSGFFTIVLVILVQFSLIMFVLSIISVYLARIFQQVLKRPISIVSDTSDFATDKKTATIEHWPGKPPKRVVLESTKDE